jgi:cytoskeletal protein CcmA (bactofilin family)
MADIQTPSLSIEDGAFFEGHCVMERSSIERTAQKVGGAGNQKIAQMPLAKER